jgi:hypothetical protein
LYFSLNAYYYVINASALYLFKDARRVDWGDEIFFVHGTSDAPPTTAKFHSEVGSYKL